MQELGFQQTGACSEVECVVEAGKLLKVEKMFAGNIGKVGRIYNINIQMIDVATAQIEINRSKPHDGTIEQIAETIIPQMAEGIVSQILGKQFKVEAPSGGLSFWWYAGGLVVLGGGAAAYVLLNKEGSKSQTTEILPNPPAFP